MEYPARREFNMAAEIREILTGNPELTARGVETLLIAKFPKQKINSTSCGVAFSNARKRLGLRSGPQPAHPDLVSLLIAKQLVDHCGGDFGQAAAVLKQLADLQMNESRD
jgi:hypothetical protein